MSSSIPRKVVIDDSDTTIRYTGSGWFQDNGSQDNFGNFGPTYKRTLHGTNSNDSLSFGFNGTSVAIIGTTNLVKIENDTRFDPAWECFVDKISIGAAKPFEFRENNWLLCEQKELNDGLHEITLNVTTTGNTFWFDSLQFTPSSSASYESAVLLVDNQDPAIKYDSKWGALGGTANFTQASGSEVKFNFTGTSLSWMGFIPTEFSHNATSASYSIDGGAPLSFKLAGLSPTTTTTVYNQLFFTTPDLPAGPHSIVVTYNGGGGFTPFTTDYLYITNTSLPQPSSTSPSTPQNSTGNSPGHSPPIGAIIGGVLGGLALIALLLFFIWWWRRRERREGVGRGPEFQPPPHEVSPFMSMYRTGSSPPMMSTTTTPPRPQTQTVPFILPSTPSHSSQPSSYQPPSSYQTSVPPSTNTNNISHAHSASLTSSSNPSVAPGAGYSWGTAADMVPMRKGQEAGLRPLPSIQPVMHQDSGIRLPQSEAPRSVVIEDVPPLYTAS